MESGNRPPHHREYEDLLAAAALGVLTPEEHAALRQHLAACSSCRATLAALQAAGEALTLTVEPMAPSPELRDRLMAAVRAEAVPRSWVPAGRSAPPAAPTPIASRRPSRIALWSLAAAAVIALAVLAGVVLDRVFLQPDDDVARTIALEFSDPVEDAQGVLLYLPDAGVLHLTTHDLPALEEGQVYQAWLIDDAGPRAVGVVDLATGELAVVTDPERDAVFAITLEPGPLGSEAPTSEPVIVAELDA